MIASPVTVERKVDGVWRIVAEFQDRSSAVRWLRSRPDSRIREPLETGREDPKSSGLLLTPGETSAMIKV